MPRPTTKNDLLVQARTERDALNKQLDTLSPAQMTQPGIVGEWSAKDVMAHLTAWEQMAIDWYEAGLRGEVPELPAPGYKWNQTPALNQYIYEKFRDVPLAEVQSAYDRSYDQIMTLIEGVAEEDLFTPSVFAWTRKNNMATYFISATSSHYRWARSEIRKGFKRLAS